MTSRFAVVRTTLLAALLASSTSSFALAAPEDAAAPDASSMQAPTVPIGRNAPAGVPTVDPIPELFHFRFDGTGTSVPNLASSPPAGTESATIMGTITQTGADLNLSGNGFSLLGNGVSSTTDYLDTGWATDLGSGSWTISFVSANFGATPVLYYIFGDGSAGSLRCFTNGVAGTNNWMLRGPLTDVLVMGGAAPEARRTTFVYDEAAAQIRAYLDGMLVTTVAQGPLNIVGTGPFKVMGYQANVGAPPGGLLDDFRVYNRALSVEEIAALDSQLGELTIDPAAVAFGDQPVDSTSAPASVTLANSGGAPLYVTELDPPAAPFELSASSCGDLPIFLPRGTDCALEYRFAPTSPGAAALSLAVASDSLGGGNIELSGTGTQGNLLIDPTAIDFGSIAVGDAVESSVTLSNTGTAGLSVTALTEPTGDFSRSVGTCPDTLPIVLAVGEGCNLVYAFGPSSAGPATQELTVSADAPGSGSIQLSGSGLQGNLLIGPAAIEFGTLAVGDVSALGTINLGNTGNGPLRIASLTAAAEPFVRTADGSCSSSLPIDIAAGADCSLTYVFAPVSAGAAQQSFSLDSNATGDSGFDLSGDAIPAANEVFLDGFESVE